MDVAIIGTGNVASILGRLIHINNYNIVHIAGRNTAAAECLAKEFNAGSSDIPGINHIKADVYIIAVSDSAIGEITGVLQVHDRLVVHTAGSVQKDILKNNSANYGILYPLQSLRKEMMVIPSIPFLIDGSNEGVTEYLYSFARSISENVQRTNDDDRLKLHAAAVIVNNFTNHLYAMAEKFCEEERISFDLLKPLIIETAQRINTLAPSALQTGPAIRKDIQTLDKHLKLFADHPKLKYLYLKLTDSIMQTSL